MGDNTPKEDMTAPVSKKDPDRDGSTESSASTPDAPDQETYTQENPQQQKRKGGRKPIYATSEERKQRNRQAQAAFRERRTEYIKQLESTIKHHEETLQSLQQSHRSAADECLMLRYKNSLLERILLEKGIDVQAELQAKTGSPNLGPVRGPQQQTSASPLQAPIQQRAIMNRHQQARRSIVGMPQKVEPLPLVQPDGILANRSPMSQPTPASHLSSPSTTATKSPNFIPQPGAIQSPNFGPLAQQPQHMRSQPPPRSQFAQPPQRPSLVTPHQNAANGNGNVMNSSASAGPNSYYPSPFQSHMDQLGKFPQQEYDAQAELLDEDPSDHSAGPGPYPPSFPPHQMSQQSPHGLGQNGPMQANQQQQQQHPQQQQQQQQQPFQSPTSLQSADQANGSTFQVPNSNGNNGNNMFDPYDPMLDADPFGLSASMHFPTQFSYESR